MPSRRYGSTALGPVEPTVTDYMGPMYEIVCQNALPSLFPNTSQGIGYSWHCTHELGVVGLGRDGTPVGGDCKNTMRQMTEGDRADLERSAHAVQWSPDGGDEPTYHRVLRWASACRR